MFPDFLGIGAQKAGTTWLHRNLQAHPQIYMPRKEVHYFDRKIDDRSNAVMRALGKRQSDVQWRRQVSHWARVRVIKNRSLKDFVWGLKYYMRSYNDEWYASVFQPKSEKVAGEITPAYSALSRKKVAHVHEIMPGTKIIFFLRNPIERAWSQVVMSFDKAEKGSAESISEEELIRRAGHEGTRLLTNYSRTLENWGAFYPEDQIFLGFLEDVHFFPKELLNNVHAYLGVDPYVEASLTTKKIHSRSADRMPTRVAVHLAQNYHQEIARLAERFGGYASFWLHCAETLINEPPRDDTLPYPLYRSSLWEEWINASDRSSREVLPGRIQSGVLASVRIAR